MKNYQKIALAGLLAFSSGSLWAVESYSVSDLGTLAENGVFATAINDANTTVGYSYLSSLSQESGNLLLNPFHGFAHKNGTNIDLGVLADENSELSMFFNINNNDTAVGVSYVTVERINNQGNAVNAVLQQGIYTSVESGLLNEIPHFLPENKQNMRALGINDNNLIVGYSLYNDPNDTNDKGDEINVLQEKSFIYDTSSDVLTRIENFNGDRRLSRNVLRDVNSSGIAVGWFDEYYRDNVFVKSFYVDISDPQNPSRISATIDGRSDTAFAINDSGIIVGKRHVNEEKRYRGYIYDMASQTFTDLEPLVQNLIPQGGFDISVAFDINEQNQVVGTAIYDIVPDLYHAIIYENDTLIDLNTRIDCKVDPGASIVGDPDWVLLDARSINESGVIVGNGLLNGQQRAFMLTPRPGVEPIACEPVVEVDEEEDSGSFGFIGLLLLLAAGFSTRRRLH